MQKLSSREQNGELERVSLLLFLAALYNLAWGVIAAVAPAEMLAWAGAGIAGRVELWQCIGMFVALYGVGYWFASTDPVRYWPFLLIGLIGKVLGPAGALVAIARGGLPRAFLWINVFNDLVWWVPFAWSLWVIHRYARSVPAGADEGGSLYRRVMGPAFDQLMTNVRTFHSATRRAEMAGVFRVTRGTTAIGNWLTDLAGFPRSQDALRVSLVVEPEGHAELWHRSFGETLIESRQFEAHGLLAERFGPLVLYLEPRATGGALEIADVRSTLWTLPVPRFLAPIVFARGADSGAGVEVLVRISCWPLGLLIEYSGIVRPKG